MRPVLINIPSKFLLVAALLLAVVTFVRDAMKRRRDPKLPRSSTPLYMLIGAELILGLRAGSWWPLGVDFSHPWPPVPIFSYGVMLDRKSVV